MTMSNTTLTIDKSPRVSREKEVRRKPWAPPSRLDAPPAPEGYKHRWIRSEINGFEDKQHVYGRLREGYELVRADELPEEYRNMLPSLDEGRHAGVVSVGGLMLARIPIETAQERDAHFRRKAREQLEAVDNEMMRENAHSSMRIQNPERSSKTTFNNR
jgi:hypothetical protein